MATGNGPGTPQLLPLGMVHIRARCIGPPSIRLSNLKEKFPNLRINFDPARGTVKSPLLLWGPYLWADGETPRKSAGLSYKREDLRENHGTHPTDSARQKVAELLLRFLKTDPTAKSWFVRATPR